MEERTSQNPIEHEQNVVFMEQRPVRATTSRIVNDYSHRAQFAKMTSMPEPKWTVDDVLTRPYMIKQGTWTTSQPRGGALYETYVPNAVNVFTNFPVVTTMSFFTFLKCNLKFRIQLNSTRFHQGRLIFYFDPLNSRDAYEQGGGKWDITQFTAMPCAYVDASDSAPIELEIPYQQIHTFMPLFNAVGVNEPYYLGTIHLFVLNQLQCSSSASPSLDYTIWQSFVAPHMHIPMHAHSLPTTQGLESLAQMIPSVVSTAQSGMKFAASAETGDIAGMFSSGKEIFNGIKSITDNLDKPTVFIPQSYSSHSSTSHGDGIDNTERLTLEPCSITQHPEEIIGDADEMNLSRLVKVPTIINFLNWATSNTTGTYLTSFNVHPMYAYIRIVSDQNYANIFPSNLGMISSRFEYWRGSIMLRFSVVATQFHTGRLLISFIPNFPAKYNQTPTYDQAKSNNTWILDIQETSDMEICIPFESPTPWKLVPAYYDTDDSRSSAILDRSNHIETTGRITIFIMNELRTPGNIANNIDINIFMNGGDDFELSCPRLEPAHFDVANQNVSIPRHEAAVTQGLEETSTESKTNTPVETRSEQPAKDLSSEVAGATKSSTGLIPDRMDQVDMKNANSSVPNNPSPRMPHMTQFFTGERCMNLKSLLRRYGMMAKPIFDSPSTHVGRITINNTPMKTTNLFRADASEAGGLSYYPISNMEFFSRMFCFWRGSLRYKLIFACNNVNQTRIVKIAHLPYTNINIPDYVTAAEFAVNTASITPQFFNTGHTIRHISAVNPTISFETAFTTAFTQLMVFPTTSNQGTISQTAAGAIEVFIEPVDGDTGLLYVNLLQSAGDDFRLNYFLGPYGAVVDKTPYVPTN